MDPESLALILLPVVQVLGLAAGWGGRHAAAKLPRLMQTQPRREREAWRHGGIETDINRERLA